VTGHYEFHDASSASRQVIRDEWKNINFTIEYIKEIEEISDPALRYITRWTAKITIGKPFNKT
jgi:DNA-dependent RNA polymerase auxiliary subunit epsilon